MPDFEKYPIKFPFWTKSATVHYFRDYKIKKFISHPVLKTEILLISK